MSIKYNDPVRDQRLAVVVKAIGSGGKIRIGTLGMASTLAVVGLSSPAFVKHAAGSIELADTPRRTASAERRGIAASAVITDADDTVIISGLTVSEIGKGGIFELTTTAIDQGQEVQVTSGIITHA